MLMGMKEGQEKMSKSDPDTAIFMEDSAEDVKRKIKKAYCPPGKVEGNPCLDWIKHVVFPKLGGRWRLARRAEDGGDADFGSYAEFEAAYAAGSLHPGDVKANLTTAINEFLEPVRAHFAQGEPKVLLEKVRKLKTTR
jgi:tyrosyl-tRNA synthetase